MPRISCADFTFPLLTRSQTFSLLRLLNFEFVDLGLFERNAHLRTSAMLASPKQFATDLVEDLARAELCATDIFVQMGLDPSQASINDPDAQVRTNNREAFERALQLCWAVGCEHITGLPGVPHGDRERDVAHAIEETQWRVAMSRTAGITYAIEPHIGSICATVEATEQFLEAVPWLTLTLDYGHFIAAGQPFHQIHRLLASASHLHLRGGAPGRLQTSFAENAIDFGALIRRLHELRYTGALALEYVWIDWEGCNRADTLSETILLREAIVRAINSTQTTRPSASAPRLHPRGHL